MRVQIEWTESVSYETVIEIDEADVRDWIRRDGRAIPDDYRISLTEAEDFLRAGDGSDWFDQCDTVRDFVSVDERDLERVAIP